jgi:phosphoribosylformylglycinamidine cyclo-ligase
MVGGQALGDALMAPTRLYVKPVLGLLADLPIAAMAHITGGGITENIIRVVPDGLGLKIDGSAWPEPPVFGWLMQAGQVARSEMWRTFNCGIGFVLVLPAEHVAEAISRLAAQGLPAWDIGAVVEHAGEGERVVID